MSKVRDINDPRVVLARRIRISVIRPLLMVLKAIGRKNQSERERSIRSYMVRPHIERIRLHGLRLCKFGFVCTVPFLVLFLMFSLFSELGGGWIACSVGAFLILSLPFLLLGIGLFLVGGVVTFGSGRISAALGAQPSESAMESWLKESFEEINEYSLERLGLVPEQVQDFQSFFIKSPILWPVEGAGEVDLLWRIGEREVFFGVYEVVVTHFADAHLGVFICNYNFLSGKFLENKTCEFHYQDVVSFETLTKFVSHVLPTGKRLQFTESFAVTVASGGTVELGVSASGLWSLLEARPPVAGDLEVAKSSIRTLLQDKKENILLPSSL